MSWECIDRIHIDHIYPLEYGNPTLEEKIQRLHYLNTQPLWDIDNLIKGCSVKNELEESELEKWFIDEFLGME